MIIKSEYANKIVWLSSYPKSGNTWFRAFLTSLFDPEGKEPDINNLYITTIASSRQMFDEFAGLSSSDLTNEEIDSLRPEVYRLSAMESEEVKYFKIHDAYTWLPNGEPLIPKEVTKSVLYFIRNPLDVAVSFANHLTTDLARTIGIMNDPEYAFCVREDKLHYQLRQKLLTWSEHVKSWVDRSRLPLMVLRYEDMLMNPLEVFTKAISFIDLEYSKGQIQKALDNSTFSKLQKQEKEKGFYERNGRSESFFRKGIAGDWKNLLTKEQVTMIVNEHREVMDRFGYLDDLNV